MKKATLKVIMALVVAGAMPGAHAAEIYLCKAYNGSTFWSNGLCSKNKAFIDRIESVPDGMIFQQQVQLAEQARAARNPPAPVQNVTIINNQPSKAAECKALDAQVAQFESMARMPQPGNMQDWITAEKRKARDRQYALRC